MRLLVLGATSAQIPFIINAKELGCKVGVVDYNNKAAAIGYADEYFECSLLNIDGVRQISETFMPDGITCGASDVGVVTAATICNERGLPSFPMETALNVKDKYRMIKAFSKCGVPHPEYVVLNKNNLGSLDNLVLSFPVVTKPLDKSGSKGINIAYNLVELNHAIEDTFSSTDDDEILIEEFMSGPEVSVEILVQDGEPHILQVTDKITTGAPHFIEIGHSQPSLLPNKDIENIKTLAYNAAKAVGIDNGCAHAEIILTTSGPKMVEIAGRLGGDFITTVLVPTSTGINMAEYEIMRALGKPKKFIRPISENKPVAVKFIQPPVGQISSYNFDFNKNEIDGVIDFDISFDVDTHYGAAHSNSDRLGYVIATGNTPKEALNRCEMIISKCKLSTF